MCKYILLLCSHLVLCYDSSVDVKASYTVELRWGTLGAKVKSVRHGIRGTREKSLKLGVAIDLYLPHIMKSGKCVGNKGQLHDHVS